MPRPTTSSAASGRPFTANTNGNGNTTTTDWARPGTARPPTAAGAASASGTGTYIDHGFHHGPQYTYDLEEEDEGDDEESEPEDDVFAYLPPTTADLSAPSQSPAAPNFPSSSSPPAPLHHIHTIHHDHHHEPFSYRPDSEQTPSPSSAAHFLPPAPTLSNTEAPSNPYSHHTPHPPLDPPTYARPESPPSTGSHIDDEHGYQLRRLEHVVTPHTPSSREVHVSLPSTGAQAQGDEKRRHPDIEMEDLESQEIAVLPKHRTTLSSPGGSMSHRAGTPSIMGSEGSIKMAFDFDAIDEEDSPYPEVRASVSNIDDPEMPALTFRMWVVGLTLLLIGTSMNVFFNFRQPAPTVVPTVLLLISHPFGRLFAYILPIKTYRLPRWLPFIGNATFSFNPGPWNIKEHVLVFIMGNVAINSPYALNVIVVAQHYYSIDIDYWFSLTLVLATQLTGFGLAGICRRFLVWPASMVWPQNLVTCTLLNTLHADEDEGTGGISRYKFFAWLCGCAFFWNFIPGFFFTGLATFSWVAWIAPHNVPVNQMLGSYNGLGMTFISFDWNQIAWIGSPLMVPWWAQLHAFGSFVLFYWICVPALYYSNTWNFGRFPLMSSIPFDQFGKPYDVRRITSNVTHEFDQAAFEAYSPLFLPVTYAMTYLLAFALSTAVLVHTALYHGRKLVNGVKRVRIEKDDIHAKLMRTYPEVPDWWYACAFVLFFSLAIVANEVWHTGLPIWGIILSVLIPCIYILPSGFIYASTSQGVTVNLISQVIPGALIEGKPMANMMFKAYSIQTLAEAQSFTQDLKLGHYVKVPPRATFIVQLVATSIAAFVQVGVKEWMFANIPDICTDGQPAKLICPHNRVFLTSSAVFGLIGPSRQFGPGALYHPEVYALLVGALLPVPFWLWERYRPGSMIKYLNIPVILTGVQYLPPATGINYSSWFLVGFIFQYVIRRRNFAWWSRFNYVASGALDSGTALSVVFIFFTLLAPKHGELVPKWWGNMVDNTTADGKNAPWRPITPQDPL